MAGTLVANTINTDTGLFATNNAYLGIAKAWVNFTGATPTILNSFNVSSITRLAQGSYTVSFTTAMANANYATIVGLSPAIGVSTGAGAWFGGVGTDASGVALSSTTSGVRIKTAAYTGPGTAYDAPEIPVSIFGA